jgi:hypothetical protein
MEVYNVALAVTYNGKKSFCSDERNNQGFPVKRENYAYMLCSYLGKFAKRIDEEIKQVHHVRAICNIAGKRVRTTCARALVTHAH